MSNEKTDRNNYDIASISHLGQEKRTNHVQSALQMDKVEKSSGQFVKVFADIFLKHEAGKKSYF
ncbi:hypothetical protein A2625_05290 [candidate division WOR-1 bacterium RIFCSPHIGHO2_01_FULL_53_15]|uniref:Uncharacterized protein n=1 Tax=candidate division WOR-1 bacterium RIFCSPHIGHO2_01_FULL_53_15 TaxID=1802564 RepID=A0A1F4Q1Y9_UNCSA|nr:MAG: hypothetical protein A2625_05290 [candidate division WOR-1 bacterium RIFCSPHIGHO2_01_FULL_53_15]OGC13084.1 MAG: hypothetical protein A3D23_00235 [candidate division WOR-1 bacterium RIFCSPHIGHO2_02_FULL_53_26]